jgi:hypothetical protein
MLDTETVKIDGHIITSKNQQVGERMPVPETEVITKTASQENNPVLLGIESTAQGDKALQLLTPSMNKDQKDEICDVLVKSVEDLLGKINTRQPKANEILKSLQEATSDKTTEEESSERVAVFSNKDREDINYSKPPSAEDMSRQGFEFLLKGAQEGRFPIILFQVSRLFCIMQFKLGLILEKDARNKKKSEGGLKHEQIVQRLKEIASYIRVANVIISASSQPMLKESQELQESTNQRHKQLVDQNSDFSNDSQKNFIN